MTKIVCNASPIIGLAAIGKLELLWRVFDEVWIPESVYGEVTVKQSGITPGSQELKDAVGSGFIKVFPVKDVEALFEWQGRLHRGELEVVFGAMEKGIHYVIIDDRLGREFARRMDLNTIGLVGILIVAKRQGFINVIKPHLDQLLSTGYRISRSLYASVLKDAGESNKS